MNFDIISFENLIVFLGAGMYIYYGHRISTAKPLITAEKIIVTFGLWCLAFVMLQYAIDFSALGFER